MCATSYLCDVKTLLATLSLFAAEPTPTPEPADTLYHIDRVEITASLKNEQHLNSAVSLSSLTMHQLEQRGIGSIKDISLIAPNFYQPDYGSSITSSIYVRGFGSRIDQPVVGVVIDDVPMMNKNSYDFDFYDIRRVELLRGPQGTLYGRNTSGGVMNITTLSPLAWQGVKAMAEYSTMTSARASAAYYARPKEHLGISFAAGYNHEGGYFRNTYTDKMCDRGNSLSARLRVQWLGKNGWSIANSLSAGYTNEGGYAYHHYIPQSDSCEPIAYNDPSGYERLVINEGFVAKYEGEKVRLSSVTSYQLLDDKMTLDQDFTPRSMFTLQQMQTEHTLTEEIVIRNARTEDRWQWLCGAFAFAKWLDMSSPVMFKRDGIEQLILHNANKGITSSGIFPEGSAIEIDANEFLIASDFRIPTYGIALYHQSSVELGRWLLSAGLRLDFEHTSMRYNSNGTIPYRFNYTMSEFKPLYTEFSGRDRQSFFELLPKLAAEYRTGIGTLYATITRGYKAGGYNTQIFSDILQVKMMDNMMNDLGIKLNNGTSTSYDTASATRYKPEKSWNFEVGTHLRPTTGLSIDATLYWIECFDQQVTVLPEGNNTGRMMSNAARARSYGVELSAEYHYKGLSIKGDYGYTDARFRRYDDGTADYSGNRLPYAPAHTLSLVATYAWAIDSRLLHEVAIAADWRGVGEIYWNEANTLRQGFYSLLGAQLTLRMRYVDVTLWGRNLTNTDYNTFYFKSVGEEFFAKGAPWHCGIRLNINL